ncbi:MAG: undecaprenyl/decaprenyl-phosphate alpha-N-acetylglucosaminyl 1-phosphate transferase [Candidatus Kerfeldbacteria bacterium]|nr:undecaprenyl/decaprenyl-phosphate alpha-N-acetylglucosaminyl 1-phosphate transferase [Candidatus Kerfeldbacteria bacterium]
MDLLSINAYIIPFGVACAVSMLCTVVVRRFAIRRGIVDRPEEAPDRKRQSQPVPLLGGVAIFCTLLLVVGGYAFFTDRVLGGYMLPKYLIGMAVAGLLLMIGGYLDDRFHLTPGKQIIWPVLACLIVIGSGIGVTYITNPFGGTVALDTIKLQLFSISHIPYYFVVLADLFAFVWLMGMMYTTKFLDGLDGLVSGITTIGACVLFFLSIHQDVAQPETALLAVILAGACAGFLIFNFHPARIYLGEGGSVLTGFMLGVLAIISGAKIATAMLVMGIPILDVAWVIVRRLWRGASPFRTADLSHLHFRLLDIGMSPRLAVVSLYALSIVFGGAAVFISNSEQKLTALLVLAAVMLLLIALIVARYHRREKGETV